MDLVYSVASLGLATVISFSVLLWCRMPTEPAWASEGWIANFWCVLITGLTAYGACFGVRFFVTFDDQTIGLPEAALVTGLLAAYGLVLYAMSPRRRLAEYAARIDGGQSSTGMPSESVLAEPATQASPGRPATPGDLSKAA